MKPSYFRLFLCAVLLTSENSIVAQAEASQPALDFKKLSIEDLLQQEVTSFSRRPQKLSEVATAIDVITGDEIRRAGATTIPYALRLATGVQVARQDSHTWAIGARGFNTTTSDKLLVLMDGRSVYTPLFSGVFWDVQDTLLEDIDRIEVIRGPGATIWGANAVNGVINIMTKSAKDTQGGLVTGGAGNEELATAGLRYGWKADDHTYARAYAKYFNRDDSELRSGADARDDWVQGQTGFRVDSYQPGDNQITTQGDFYQGTVGQLTAADIELRGANLLNRWTHLFSPDSDLQLQAYYDRTERNLPPFFMEKRDTLDLDFQHRIQFNDMNDFTWGTEYRFTATDIGNGPTLAFIPANRQDHLISWFVQDEITLVPHLLGLTVGSKFEHNDYSGFEWQPSVRLAYTPTSSQTFWGAFSRAVRTPSQIDSDVQFRNASGGLLLAGSRNFESEEVWATEFGYRVQLTPKLSIDLATFYNQYDNLRSEELEGSGASAVYIIRNRVEAETYGCELTTRAELFPWWNVKLGYTHIQEAFSHEPGSVDPTNGRAEGNDPSNMFTLNSAWDLCRNVELNAIVRFVDELPQPFIPSYTMLDLRLGWRPRQDLEVALIGQNLLDDRHPEFGTQSATSREVERTIYGKVTWQF